MGLYDEPQGMLDPKTAGLLAAGFGMLQASGPSRMPVPFGAAVGQAGMQGMGAYQSAANTARTFQQQQALIDLEKQKTALTAAQVKALLQKEGMQDAFNQHISALFNPTNPGPAAMSVGASQGDVGPTVTNADRMKTIPQGANGFTGMTPQQLFQLASLGGVNGINTTPMIEGWKVANPELHFAPGDLPRDPRTGQPMTGVPAAPQTNQQGFSTTPQMLPNGQIGVGVTPGAEDAFRRQQEIGERARASMDLVTVPASSPNQNPRLVPRAQLVDQATPRPAAPAAQVPQPTQAYAPAAPAVAPAAPGIAAGLTPEAAANVEADKAGKVANAQDYQKIFNNLNNASFQNPPKIAQYEQIGKLLGDFEGGKFSQSGYELARAANSAGIKLDPKLPNKEAAEAISREAALHLRDPSTGAGMPGSLSNSDREYLSSLTPQLGQTAEGRKKIIDARVAMWKREMQVGQFARNYRQRSGRNIDDNFTSQLQAWSADHPLFK